MTIFVRSNTRNGWHPFRRYGHAVPEGGEVHKHAEERGRTPGAVRADGRPGGHLHQGVGPPLGPGPARSATWAPGRPRAKPVLGRPPVGLEEGPADPGSSPETIAPETGPGGGPPNQVPPKLWTSETSRRARRSPAHSSEPSGSARCSQWRRPPRTRRRDARWRSHRAAPRPGRGRRRSGGSAPHRGCRRAPRTPPRRRRPPRSPAAPGASGPASPAWRPAPDCMRHAERSQGAVPFSPRRGHRSPRRRTRPPP